MSGFLAYILPVGPGQPDNTLPQPPVYPGQGLPQPPVYPGQGLPPGQGGRPGQGLPPFPSQGLPGQGGRPDQGLPGSQPGIDNSLPYPGYRPDQGLPPTAGNKPVYPAASEQDIPEMPDGPPDPATAGEYVLVVMGQGEFKWAWVEEEGVAEPK